MFLASRLVVMSPRPGRIVESIELGFGRQFADGMPAGAVKAQPAFIATREHVKSLIFANRQLAEVLP